MSAARRKNERKAKGDRGKAAGGGRGRTSRKGLPMSRLASIVAAIVVIAIIALWWSSRPPVTRPPVTGAVAESTLTVAAIIDSQRVAVTSQDWAASLHWARLLSDREPNQPLRLLGYGMAWHNWAIAGARSARERSATRTSLDRARMEQHALAVLDSASRLARQPEDAARIQHWQGQIYEIYGLPIEAALHYQNALAIVPDFALSVPRASYVMQLLHDPLRTPR